MAHNPPQIAVKPRWLLPMRYLEPQRRADGIGKIAGNPCPSWWVMQDSNLRPAD